MSIGILARRWVALLVALLGSALTLTGMATALLLPPLTYQATSEALLVLPNVSFSTRLVVNPILYQQPQLIPLANVPLPAIRSDDFRQTMRDAGYESNFKVHADYTTPVVRFGVEGDQPADVDATMAELRRSYDDLIRQAQLEEGVPDRQFASVREVQSIASTPISGDRARAAVAIGMVGVVLTLSAVVLAQRHSGDPPDRPRRGTPSYQLVSDGRHRKRRVARKPVPLPAVTFLIVYVGLLLLIPSRLGIAAIGGPGKPSSLWALLGLGLWGFMTLARLNEGRTRPIRIATGALALAVAASYVAGHLVGWYQPADIHQRYNPMWRAATPPELREVLISASDRGLLAMAGWLGVVLLAAEGLRSWKDLERLTSWIVRFAGVIALLGLLQYFTGINVAAYIQIPGLSTALDHTTYSRSILNRVNSTSSHPIEFGVMMAGLLPLALHRSLHNKNVGSWVPTALIAMMVLMSVSRSAVLVAGAAMIVLFIGWPARLRLLALIAAPVLAFAGRAAFPGLLGTIIGLFKSIQGGDPSVEGRTQDYPFVIEAFVQDPLFGRGMYTWATYYFRTLDNQVLVTALELGVVGLLALFGLFATGFVCGVMCRRYTPDPRRRHLGLSLAAAIAGVSLSYVTFDALSFTQTAGLNFLLAGMAGAAWRLSREDRSRPTEIGTHSRSFDTPVLVER